MKMKINQNGRSMIEMLGVLAIVGVLSVGGIYAYSKAMDKYKTDTLLEGITYTLNNIKTLFLTQDTLKGLDTEEAYEVGAISDQFKRQEDKIIHQYGGEVEVVATTVEGDETTEDTVYYAIKIKNLPRKAALEIATRDWATDDLVSINLNDGE